MSESYSVEAILRANVSDFVSGIKQAKSQMDNFVSNNQKTFDSFKQVGAAATAGGVAIAAGLVGAVKVSSDFQSAFAGVRKTVDGSEADFKQLETGIRNMAKELPATTTEIAGVAEAAGQLGIEKESILSFTRTMIDLGEATNLTADEAATSFAQFANVVGMPQENFDRLGSTVVALGNTMATTEADIVSMAMRLSGTGAQVGLTEAQIMALAGTMASVGINAEAGGSAMSTVMKKISNAVAEGGEAVSGFAEASGMSSKEFTAAWENDPITALDSFIKGLSESGIEGENLNKILSDLGIKGIQETDTLLRLAGASDLLGEAVNTASTAWEENSALSEEAAQRYETFESKMGILKNTITDIAISIGNVLLPAVTTMIEFVQGLAEKFSLLDEKTMTIIAVIATLAAGFLLLVGPLLMIVGFIPSILAGFTALSTVATALGTAFGVLTGPIGLTIAAIIAIGAALVLAYNKVEWFRDAVNAAWGKLAELATQAFNSVKEAVSTAMTAVVEFARSKLDELLAFWNENGAQISQAAQNVWNVISTVIGAAMTVITGVIQVAWFLIQTIVKAVWENIKGVISGALNIIMGLVKVFASLFTADWQGMWEGVKQLFSGAVEFLWNAVQLLLWGRMLKGIAVFAGTFRGAVTTMWGGIKSAFSAGINFVKSIFTNGFRVIQTTANTVMNAMRSVITSVWNGIKSVFSSSVNAVKSFVTNGFNAIRSVITSIMNAVRSVISSVWNAIKSTISNAVNGIKSAISSGFNAALGIIKSTMSSMVSTVKNAASKFFQAGKDLVSGLINGIKSMASAAVNAIAGVVDGVVSKAKAALRIKSPSRVFMAIGSDTVKGLEVGIDKRRVNARKSVDALFASVMQSTKEGFKKERAEIEKNNAEMKKIEQRSAEDILLIKQKAAQRKKALTSAELIKIRRIEEDAAKKLQSLKEKNNKIELDMNDKQMKEFLAASEKYIENKRKNGQMSLADEVYFWNAMYKNAKKGSEQYETGMKNHQAAVKDMRSQIESTNKEYTDKMLAIDKEYSDESQKLQDSLMQAREKQMDQLINFVGIFDKFEKKTEASGTDLVDNLHSQLVALEEYDEVISQLGTRIKDKELLAQLKSMGVKSLGELQALNSLSDYELQTYANIYQEKFKLAAKHTEQEMRPMVSEVNQQLVEMSEQANKRLEELNQEWRKKIKRIVNGVDKEFDSMHQVGIDAMAGLGSGMASMNADLQRQAERIADTIKKTIKNAFDINSPSRWMHNMVGKNMMIGWIDGMESMRGRVNKVASSMADAAKVNLTSDMPNQINAINRQANKQMQTDFANNFSVDKQPAVINVHVGGHQIAREIVDDINSLQASQHAIRGSSYGY